MANGYRHGVEAVRSSAVAPRPVGLRAVSAIGLVGTAQAGPAHTPKLISSLGAGLALFGDSGGTLPDALRAIFAQASARVICVNVFDPDPDSATTSLTAVADEVVNDVAGTAQLDNSPVAASSLVLQNSDKTATYVRDTHYTLDAATGAITRIDGAAGVYVAGADLKASYKWGDLSVVTDAMLIGTDAGGTGAWALAAAETATGARPLILCAPGWTGKVTRGAGDVVTGAPVASGIGAVADRLRAVLVADGPAATEADAIAYAGVLGSDRTLVVDPKVLVDPGDGTDLVERWPSAYVAGAIARNDAENGWWTSPSNRPVRGIVGTTRPAALDPGGSADRLNAAAVATIARRNGYRLWGSRTPGGEGAEVFLSARRIMDRVEMALIDSYDWAVDRNVSNDFLESVAEGARAFLRSLQAPDVGAILAGSCDPADRGVNTDAAIAAGRVYFDLAVTPAVPAERITFRVRLGTDYSAALGGTEAS